MKEAACECVGFFLILFVKRRVCGFYHDAITNILVLMHVENKNQKWFVQFSLWIGWIP